MIEIDAIITCMRNSLIIWIILPVILIVSTTVRSNCPYAVYTLRAQTAAKIEWSSKYSTLVELGIPIKTIYT